LSLTGGFAVDNVDVNMAAVEFAAELEGQRFTLPIGSFKSGKAKFSCSKAAVNEGGLATGNFDFKNAAFTLSIKGIEITAGPGTREFKIEFDTFSESDDVVLP
jgi:hypothetical protein